MEGFDGRHVSELIHCPKRYFVVGLVPFAMRLGTWYLMNDLVKNALRYLNSKENNAFVYIHVISIVISHSHETQENVVTV